MGLKMIKIDPKMTPYKFVKNGAKNQFSRGGSGGAKIVKNRPRGPGTLK
jgi:hypothetical protein